MVGLSVNSAVPPPIRIISILLPRASLSLLKDILKLVRAVHHMFSRIPNSNSVSVDLRVSRISAIQRHFQRLQGRKLRRGAQFSMGPLKAWKCSFYYIHSTYQTLGPHKPVMHYHSHPNFLFIISIYYFHLKKNILKKFHFGKEQINNNFL